MRNKVLDQADFASTINKLLRVKRFTEDRDKEIEKVELERQAGTRDNSKSHELEPGSLVQVSQQTFLRDYWSRQLQQVQRAHFLIFQFFYCVLLYVEWFKKHIVFVQVLEIFRNFLNFSYIYNVNWHDDVMIHNIEKIM